MVVRHNFDRNKKANGLLANWKFNRSQIGATLLPQSEVFPEVNLYPPPAFYAKLDSLPGAHAIIQPLNENYSFDAENEAGGQKTTEKTTDRTADRIVHAIKDNPYVTSSELSEICGITIDGINWQLKNLKSSGVIARIGGKRFGHWEVCDEINAEIAAARNGK